MGALLSTPGAQATPDAVANQLYEILLLVRNGVVKLAKLAAEWLGKS
eukprot:SAG31_NODE_29759_length_390_cov_0.879725_1_plen_46_part_10